jgi:hypothetical protein
MVKRRDGYKCLKCGRNNFEATLQVHHTTYRITLKPWEYALSECWTLCKMCHAHQHKLIEPNFGWTLIEINDREALDGICEMKGCGNEIRYEHVIYHPDWGYKTVGSTCVEYLTQDDQFLGDRVIKALKKVSEFVRESVWNEGTTKKGIHFIYSIYAYSEIRIYGKPGNYSFQLAIKEKGIRWHEYSKFYSTRPKSIIKTKELGFIKLKSQITEDAKEAEILENIFQNML